MRGTHVYLITESHLHDSKDKVPFKIGISQNPGCRVYDLNAGNARPLVVLYCSPPFERSDALDMEREAHDELRAWALGREWFHCPLEYGLDALRSVGALNDQGS